MSYRLWPGRGVRARRIRIGRMPALVLSPKASGGTGSVSVPAGALAGAATGGAPGILWIHGGGYRIGMKEMVYMGRAENLVRRFGAVVISPGYRLSLQAPYPAAIEDCYEALLYLKEHVQELGVRDDQIMVGGESAGGGLAAALCMMARDRGEVSIAYQMPLYPMIDDRDTVSSRDNHGKIWNTRKNHSAWKLYLRGLREGRALPKEAPEKAPEKTPGKTSEMPEVSPYAAAARQTDYRGLPPAYTFVGDGEPFYAETLTFVENLRRAGVPAKVDVYHSDIHAFDMLCPWKEESRRAIARFEEEFAYAAAHYFAAQPVKN